MAVKWEVADTPKSVVINRVLGFPMEQVYTQIIGERRLKKMAKEKIKIRLKSYDHRLLDQSAKKIVDSVKKTGSVVNGP